MKMSLDLALYEALTEAGVKPDTAHRVERKLESAIEKALDDNRKEIVSGLATREDSANLRAEMQKGFADMHRSMTEMTWRLVTFVVATGGMVVAIIKLSS